MNGMAKTSHLPWVHTIFQSIPDSVTPSLKYEKQACEQDAPGGV